MTYKLNPAVQEKVASAYVEMAEVMELVLRKIASIPIIESGPHELVVRRRIVAKWLNALAYIAYLPQPYADPSSIKLNPECLQWAIESTPGFRAACGLGEAEIDKLIQEILNE